MQTLNEILVRLEAICTAHKMVNDYQFGTLDDFLDNRDINYPAVFVPLPQVSTAGKQQSFTFKLFIMDLQILSDDNLQDGLSDCLGIANDLFAQVMYPLSPWIVDGTAAFELFEEDREDSLLGVSVEFTIKLPYLQDRCQIPTTYVY